MTLRFGALSDPGLHRRENEDRVVADTALGLFAVVDGMGGHAGGAFAASTVAETIVALIRASSGTNDPPAVRLEAAILGANQVLAERLLEQTDATGGGATLAAVLVDGSHIAIAHVGDCRVYVLADGILSPLTRDHSLVAEQVAQGLIAAEDAKTHPLRHVVTRAVSGQSGIVVDTRELVVHPGDRLLLCSDGIHGVLTDKQMSELVSTPGQTLDEACRAVIAEVNARGGPDNATLIVVHP